MTTQITPTPPNVRTAETRGGYAVPVPALDWDLAQLVAVGAASAHSSVFDANRDRIVELSVSTDTWYTVGKPGATAAAAAATVGNQFISSGSLRYVYVPANCEIAVIQASAGGNAAMIPALSEV